MALFITSDNQAWELKKSHTANLTLGCNELAALEETLFKLNCKKRNSKHYIHNFEHFKSKKQFAIAYTTATYNIIS